MANLGEIEKGVSIPVWALTSRRALVLHNKIFTINFVIFYNYLEEAKRNENFV